MKHRASVLRVILDTHVPAVVTKLDSLDEPGIGILAGAEHTCLFVVLPVLAIELKAVAVTLPDEVGAVGSGDLGSRATIRQGKSWLS